MLKTLGILALIILAIGNAIYSGFVFSVIWGYFIVPLGVAALSIPHALGIISVAFYPFLTLSMRLEMIKPTEWQMKSWTSNAIAVTLMISFVWGITSIYHAFM